MLNIAQWHQSTATSSSSNTILSNKYPHVPSNNNKQQNPSKSSTQRWENSSTHCNHKRSSKMISVRQTRKKANYYCFRICQNTSRQTQDFKEVEKSLFLSVHHYKAKALQTVFKKVHVYILYLWFKHRKKKERKILSSQQFIKRMNQKNALFLHFCIYAAF